jgi:uncharacterized protein YdiU (UPF0061 family)
LFLLAPNTQEAVSIAETSLGTFYTQYQNFWLNGWREKLALNAQADDSDTRFITDYLKCLNLYKLDFTYTNRTLAQALEHELPAVDLSDKPQLHLWLNQWRHRLANQDATIDTLKTTLCAANPAYIPRNYWVEEAIKQAQEFQDFSLFHELTQLVKNPFCEQEGASKFSSPPPSFSAPYQTFCGT